LVGLGVREQFVYGYCECAEREIGNIMVTVYCHSKSESRNVM
jgi:hypothetical protein